MFDDDLDFSWKRFDELAPRLLSQDKFRELLIEDSKSELEAPICDEELDSYKDLPDDRRLDILRVLQSVIFNEEGEEEVIQSWDGDASGSVTIYSHSDFYYFSCIDRGMGGPSGYISEAIDHDYFEGALSNPEIIAKNLSKEQLDKLVHRTVDWDNEGDIYINGERYEVVGDELRPAKDKKD